MLSIPYFLAFFNYFNLFGKVFRSLVFFSPLSLSFRLTASAEAEKVSVTKKLSLALDEFAKLGNIGSDFVELARSGWFGSFNVFLLALTVFDTFLDRFLQILPVLRKLLLNLHDLQDLGVDAIILFSFIKYSSCLANTCPFSKNERVIF